MRKVGDSGLATVAAQRAAILAREVCDGRLEAAALYRLANVMLASGHSIAALQIAMQAAALVDPAKPQPGGVAMWGAVLLTAAVAAARQRDASQAWELFGQAQAAARIVGSDQTDMYAIFGPTNVAVHGVQIAVELDDGLDGLRRSQHVPDASLPASLAERRGQLLIDIAHAHVLVGNDPEAVATIKQARLVAQQEVDYSGDVRDLLSVMLSRERAGRAPGLRELAAVVANEEEW